MSFGAPAFLVLLLAVPLAIWAYVRYERRGTAGRAAFAAPAMLASVAPKRAGWRRHAPLALYAVALTALVVALAKPQTTVAVPIEQATVMLVFDRSGSMESEDVAPNRLAAAREAARSFIERVPDDIRVGAVAFNQNVRALHSPTRDHAAVRRSLDRIKPAGSTATGDGLDRALRTAQQPALPGQGPPPAAIVLLSDGKSVKGQDPVQVAQRAGRAKVPIYAIALGTDEGTIQVPIPGPSGRTRTEEVPPDRATMQKIAEASGGRAFSTADAGELDRIYKSLGSQVSREDKPREITAGFAGGALLLVLAAAGLSLRWFGRLT